ncbi:translation factor GUF1, mitochondrial isoform X2 [Eurytemora carolleeae]|uniref:translation factor GUF1, mitochondrial isoform X2 n=1 Tax=Eurytemora carolleeae TaxID=1294199 RepID=UPI000C780EF6|nr:translation factor GUF1, mitochondrial isoform X2 [Eurytemora carolleeae]|eukprot:XP_023327660.1 translation factor GUF1, mitochondrial-like isoform X2 [Eurytemora affinis]
MRQPSEQLKMSILRTFHQRKLEISEIVGAIDVSANNKQVLDKLQVERERGITVKAQSVSVLYQFKGEEYILNLIDTPGHVDFSYEVTRSLRACQGVLLLVDANQGVQAQTVSNFYQAFANNLEIIPVINKIDLPNANPDAVREQLYSLFELDPGKVLLISAKLGTGVKQLLDAVVQLIPPPPSAAPNADLALFLFDSWFDRYKGAINLVQVKSGIVYNASNIVSCKTGKEYSVKSVGVITPETVECTALYSGQVGYIICNMRSTKEAVIGDTFHLKGKPVPPLLEIAAAKPMLFAGFYPFNAGEYKDLRAAIDKLCINDNSVTLSDESSPALGYGWRIGFLGVLHMEVFSQRLEQEYEAEVLITAPSVPYRLIIKGEGNKKKYGKEITVSNPANWLERMNVEEYQEPIVHATMITPVEYLSPILELCNDRRGEQISILNLDQTRLNMQFIFPLNEIATDFFDELKSRSSGFASLDYEDAGYRASDLVKLDIHLNGNPIGELSSIVHVSKIKTKAKYLVGKMKDELPRQQFAIAIQAMVGSKVFAREDVKALRKDVTAKCYGGDISRKMKLLKNQAEGKRKMKKVGNIQIAKETFVNILTNKR